MTDAQMYVVIGVPVFAIVMAMVVSMFQFSALDLRITRFETALNARFTSFENRFTSLETSVNARFASLKSRFDTNGESD